MEFLNSPFVYVTGILALNIFLLVVFLIASAYLVKKLLRSQSEAEKERRKIRAEAEQVAANARSEARRILQSATENSLKVIADAKNFREVIEKELVDIRKEILKRETDKIEEASASLISGYRDAFRDVNQAYSAALGALPEKIKADADEAVSEFQKALLEGAKHQKEEMNSKIEELYRVAQTDVEYYRAAILSKTAEFLKKILSLSFERVFGETLTLKEKEQLVLRALDKAKTEGFFEHFKKS